MPRQITLQIAFPQTEFEKLMSKYLNASSVRHQMNENPFYLGDIQSAQKLNQSQLFIILEVRKDETPGWYIKEILSKALKEEILIMNGSEVICRRGKIVKIEGLNQCLDDDIIEPLKARIVPKKERSES